MPGAGVCRKPTCRDVEGRCGRQIAILASLAYGGAVDRAPSLPDGSAAWEDSRCALRAQLGYCVKLLRWRKPRHRSDCSEQLDVRGPTPTLIPKDHPLAGAWGQ